MKSVVKALYLKQLPVKKALMFAGAHSRSDLILLHTVYICWHPESNPFYITHLLYFLFLNMWERTGKYKCKGVTKIVSCLYDLVVLVP